MRPKGLKGKRRYDKNESKSASDTSVLRALGCQHDVYILFKEEGRRGRGCAFPFGSILHTHSRHCRRCRGRNLLRDVPVGDKNQL